MEMIIKAKSALNDKKRNGVKLTIEEVIFGGTTSSSKMVQQMIKTLLKSIYMIRNKKSYFLLLSFFVFCVAKSVVFYHFFGPIPSPIAKFVPVYLMLNTLLSIAYINH
ncbi:MAG: hypothetical protein K5764_02370 [Prevotella sp.]|nr:hypothetical protein [Prevotella sp.]